MTTSAEQLAEAIATLGDAANAFNSQVDDIDARLNGLLPSVNGAMRKVIYINAVTGSDETGTGEVASPVRSFAGAAALMVSGGNYSFVLQTDMIMDEVVSLNGQVAISSDVLETKRRITWAPQVDLETTSSPRFSCRLPVMGVHFRDITFVNVELAAHVTSRSMIGCATLTAISTFRCDWEVPANSNCSFVGGNEMMSMWLVSSTVPAEMGGLWMEGIAAGTDPASVGRLLAFNYTL